LNKTYFLKKGDTILADIHFVVYLEDFGPNATLEEENDLNDIPEIKIDYPKP